MIEEILKKYQNQKEESEGDSEEAMALVHFVTVIGDMGIGLGLTSNTVIKKESIKELEKLGITSQEVKEIYSSAVDAFDKSANELSVLIKEKIEEKLKVKARVINTGQPEKNSGDEKLN